MHRIRSCQLALWVLLGVATLGSQPDTVDAANVPDQPAADRSNHTLDDFHWLAGAWRGQGFGGTCEETWSKPAGDSMMGMFRLLRDDQVVFYEFMRIVDQDGVITLEIKHFTPDFEGWEEKADAVRFPLKEVADGRAVFDGLTMERTGDGGLVIAVMIGQKDGSRVEQRVQLQRAQLTDP